MEGARGTQSLSFSMRMTVYGIEKVFPSVRNVSCSEVEEWRLNDSKKLVCVVSVVLYHGHLCCACEIFLCQSFIKDVRPEEEFSVSHVPGAVRVEPSTQPDLQALGITPDATGESNSTSMRGK